MGNTVRIPDQDQNFGQKALRYASLAGSFFITFLIYISTLAPTVTFEDSGELIAAAYTLGIPHQPGYPLFTLLGRVFSMIPLENVAYRLNLMSAVLTALAALFLTWTLLLLMEEIRLPGRGKLPHQSSTSGLKYLSALAGGILFSTAFEVWEQSVITEVYGLNNLQVSLFLWLMVRWGQQPDHREKLRYFLAICYLTGLALSNHTTSLMYLPLITGFVLVTDRKFFLNLKTVFGSFAFLLLGITPYGYLPIASARNPWMDWGNPENWTNFIRTVSRHQYGLQGDRSLPGYLAQLQAFAELFSEQWAIWVLPVVLVMTATGLIVLYRYRRNYFYFSLLFLLFTIPVTTYLTNFDVTVKNPFVVAEHRALVSVFYIPAYLYVSLLAGLGIFFGLSWIQPHKNLRYFIFPAVLMIPLSGVISSHPKLDMSRYYYTADYVHNLFGIAGPRAVIFADWDPYYFPLNYYQYVEGKRPDILAIDQQLLRRSWYIQWLRDHYPQFMQPLAADVNRFLAALKPFEDHQPFNANLIEHQYQNMIKAMVDHAMSTEREVYFTYDPPPMIIRTYFLEPVLVAIKLRTSDQQLSAIDRATLQFRNFTGSHPDADRWVAVFQNYYARLFIARAQLHEMRGEWRDAMDVYQASLQLYSRQPHVSRQIEAHIRKLQEQKGSSE